MMDEEYIKKHKNELTPIGDKTTFLWKNRIRFNLPATEREFHERIIKDYLPASPVATNVPEVFSLLIQLAYAGQKFLMKKDVPRKVDDLTKKMFEVMISEETSDTSSGLFGPYDEEEALEDSEEKVKEILKGWLFENLVLYREDKKPNIEKNFITVFPYHAHISCYWGIKEAKRIEKFLLQLLIDKNAEGQDKYKIFKKIRQFFEKDDIETVGVIGKIILVALEEEIKQLKISNPKKAIEKLEKQSSEIFDPICKVHATQMREDILAVLRLEEKFNRETIVNWLFTIISTHIALYFNRIAKIFEKNMNEIFKIKFNGLNKLQLADCNSCKIDKRDLRKCPFTPKVYPKIDNDPIVHKRSHYRDACVQDEIMISKLPIYATIFKLIRNCMEAYYKASESKLFDFKDFAQKYNKDQEFRAFTETYFGLLLSRYLTLPKITIDRKEYYFEELIKNERKYGTNIKRLYDVINAHYDKQTSGKDTRKNYFSFYKNMAFAMGNGFLKKRRGVGSYYTLPDVLIQLFVQIAVTQLQSIIPYDEFKIFLNNRGIHISPEDKPNDIENIGLKNTLTKLGMFYEASDAKEAQFVYGIGI